MDHLADSAASRTLRGADDDRPVRALLFDMGGVLVELTGEAHLTALFGKRLTRDEIWNLWLHSPAVRAHEKGEIDARTFARRAIDEFGVEVAPDEFLASFKAWIKAPFVDTHALLAHTSRHFTTAILTNTSALHWPLIESFGLPSAVHHMVASFQIGEIKPDAAFFARALDIVGVRADEALFFDDVDINVGAARKFGLRAHQVRGPRDIRATLESLALLPA